MVMGVYQGGGHILLLRTMRRFSRPGCDNHWPSPAWWSFEGLAALKRLHIHNDHSQGIGPLLGRRFPVIQGSKYVLDTAGL